MNRCLLSLVTLVLTVMMSLHAIGQTRSVTVYAGGSTLRTVSVNGQDRGDYAYADHVVGRSAGPASKFDPHCFNKSGLFGATYGANCVELCVTLPSNKQPNLKRIETFAGLSQSNPLPCPAAKGRCDIDFSKWYAVPTWKPASHEVCGTYKNWNASSDHYISIHIYYQ
jgi:hypothetical protein